MYSGRECGGARVQEADHSSVQRAPGAPDPRRLQQETGRMVRPLQDRQRGQTTQGLRLFGRRDQGLWRGDPIPARHQGSFEDPELDMSGL